MRTIIYISLFLSPFLLPSQNLDYVWLFGYNTGTSNPEFGGSIIDFSSYPPEVYPQETEASFRQANASICNEEGELLFYSNGLAVYNQMHEQMFFGDGLNPGEYTDGQGDGGYTVGQGVLALPRPGSESNYYLMHTSMEYPTPEVDWHSSRIYCTRIGMAHLDGLGIVVQKNKVVVTDTLVYGKLTAARHGNGRDWWLLSYKMEQNKYHRVLVDAEGVHSLGLAEEGEALPDEGLGQVVFSPDGRYYARVNGISTSAGQYLEIYEFDRCTGLLSNQVLGHYFEANVSAGIAISPNSRYLYMNTGINVSQFDLHADDILASRIIVAEYDGFLDDDFFATLFYLSQLAPDGKIYISSPNGTRYLHVIHYPDRPGLECQVEQHGVNLPTWNAFSMPNFPNYRLGPLDGSPCDTLGLDNHPVAKFRYDEDTLDYLTVDFTDLSYYAPTEWHWDFGDNTMSDEKSPVHTFPGDGSYEICLTVANEYSENTFCQTLFLGTSATGEVRPEVGITVFPNPAKGATNVILSDGYLPKAGRIVFYDGVGRPCFTQPVRSGWNNVQFYDLSPGLYFYEVKDGAAVLGSGKLVVTE